MKARREFLKGAAISAVAFSGLGYTSKPSVENNYDIKSLGAKPDGKTLNTTIIQKTIDICSENGGGRVIFSSGNYLTGTFKLKSGVTLYIEKGATISGSTNINDYIPIIPEYSALGTNSYTRQLIYAENQQDIAILGEGTINGQGIVFERHGDGKTPPRPLGFRFITCKNIRHEGIFMTNFGSWAQHYLACDKLQIRGIRVYNHCNYNNDGLNIDGCHDAIISDCIIDSDDDGIVLKSTSPRECKNVLVNNCHVRSFCNALKLGTESTGGFRNVIISNCTVTPCEEQKRYYGTALGQSAISVEMVDGGTLEQVAIDRITIEDTACPIFIRLGNRARKHADYAPQPGIGVLRNVRISNIIATTSSITASNITGIIGSYADNIHLENIILNINSKSETSDAGIIVPEKDTAYPTAGMFGNRLPASAFFVRHVKNIRFLNLHIIIGKDNFLPALVLDDVKNAKIYFTELTTENNNKLLKKTSDCEKIEVL